MPANRQGIVAALRRASPEPALKPGYPLSSPEDLDDWEVICRPYKFLSTLVSYTNNPTESAREVGKAVPAVASLYIYIFGTSEL